MPIVKSWGSHVYEPRPLNASPARETPQNQTKRRPTTDEPTGKFGGLGKKVSGGSMNGGGKRRPGHNARKGID